MCFIQPHDRPALMPNAYGRPAYALTVVCYVKGMMRLSLANARFSRNTLTGKHQTRETHKPLTRKVSNYHHNVVHITCCSGGGQPHLGHDTDRLHSGVNHTTDRRL